MKTSATQTVDRPARTLSFAASAAARPASASRSAQSTSRRSGGGLLQATMALVCLAVFVMGAAPAFATSYFNQDFQSSTVVSSYVNLSSPTAGQWNDLSNSGGTIAISTSAGNNVLRFSRGSGNTLWFTRSTDLASPVPTAIIYRFSLSTSNGTTAATTPAVLRVGSGFTTGGTDATDASTYAKLGILVDNTNNQFRIQDITNAATNSALFSGTQTVTWVLNNSGATLNYQAPDSTSEAVANDRADVWVGTTKVFNDVLVQTAAGSLSDLKFFFTTNNGFENLDFDNFDIQTLPPTLSLTQTAATCAGNDGTITATFANGTGPYQVKLDGGALAAHTSPFQFTGVAGGTHLVTVQDATGAQTYKTIVVTAPAAIGLSLAQTATTCNAATDGKVTATWTNGVGPFQVKIDAGSFSAGTSPTTFLNLAPGSHTVTVQDANLCTATNSVTVTAAPALVLSLVSGNPCFGSTNGVIVATFSGGTGTLQTSIDGGAFTTVATPRSFTGLAAGLHTVTVRDANLCTASQSVTLVQNAALALALSKTDVLCSGGTTGTIVATYSGGTGALQLALDGTTFTTFTSPHTFTGINAGSHIIRLRDSNPNSPCRDSLSITVNQPTAVALSLSQTNLTCNGVSTGTVTATFSGGTPPYTIRIDANAFAAQTSPFTFTGLASGSHTVNVLDANACAANQTATLTQPTAIALALTPGDVSCYNGTDGTIVATFSGGTGTLQSSIDGGAFTTVASPRTFSALAPGSHSVTIRDASLCTSVLSATVGAPPTINMTLSAADVNCAGASNGSVTATFSGGTPTGTTVFSQNFGAAGVYTDYVSAGAPNAGQWNAISGSTTSNITTASNYLQFIRSGGTYSFVRTTAFSPTPTAVIFKFDYTPIAYTSTGTGSETFRFGTNGLSTTNADETNDNNTFARFQINHTAATPTFQIQNAAGTTVTGGPFSGTQPFMWIMNNSGGTLAYTTPTGGSQIIGNDRMELWVGNTQVIDDGAVTTPAVAITSFKWVWDANSGTVRFDNFQIQSLSGPPLSAIDGGAFTSVASPRTFTGLAAGSHTVSVKDLAGCLNTQSITVGTNPTLFTVAASAGANGSISPSGSVSVSCGSNQAFTITPNACYTVANVLVDGASVGAVTSYAFNNVQANHTIAATFAPGTATITASAGAGGTISPTGAVIVSCGSDQAFSVTPDGCHTIADVLVDGISVGALSSYTFTNVTSAHTIAASFAVIVETITASAGTGGSISPSGATPVNCGSSQSFTIAPDPCYQILDVTVDGLSVGAVASYAFTNVTAAHTIAATFVQGDPTITASAGANGSISPSGAVTVICAQGQTFTFTPAACYQVAAVLVDGVSVGAVPSYSFTNVTSNRTIAVSFSQTVKTIMASAGAGGSISPSGATSVNCGTDRAFTIAPSACFAIEDVVVDGSSVGAVGSYTFTNVTANHTIAASFVATTYSVVASAGAGGTISPTGSVSVACNANQAFTIANDACHTIADVLVDGVSVGAVGSYTFTNVVANHTIAASFTALQKTIVASAGANGSISPSGNVSVNCGSDQLFTFTPSSSCYKVVDVLIDNATFLGPVPNYTFTNVQANHTIQVTFGIKGPYLIAANSAGPGTISPSGAVSVPCGGSQTFTITPNTCAAISSMSVDGSPITPVTSYTFTNVSDNSHTISVVFAAGNLSIAASAGSGGAISPSGTAAVNCHDNATYTITPSSCFSIAAVLVDGASVGAVATYTFTDVTASHTIAASFVQATYTITASAGANGSISPSGAVAVNCGTSQAFTIAPASCFVVADVLVDGSSVGAVSTYSFTNVTAAHTISATFAAATYMIAASATGGGSITPSGSVTVNCGADQSFTMAPTANHHAVDVLVDGVSVGAVTSYTFTNVQAAHTIAATFAADSYTITASAGPNGSIAPAGVTTLSAGDNQAYAITPNAFYHVQDVVVDGVSAGALTSYTITNVLANHTIAATFAIDTYTIFATTGANGTVTPLGATLVNHGGAQAYTVAANSCYHIADVLVDGVSVGAVAAYTFTNVTAPHTIATSFALDSYAITASAGPNGTISPSGVTPVGCGATQSYTIAANACYHITDVLVDGSSVGAVTSYSFANVLASHTIAASFAVDIQTIAASAGTGGSINPTGSVAVNCGSSQTFTITPATCYNINDVLVDGTTFLGPVTTYTFSNVTDNTHSIVATFTLRTYSIAVSAGAHGTITPASVGVLNCGTDQSFVIAPAACYQIADVTVDGISQGALTSYTFTNLQASHVIAATFVSGAPTITASAGSHGNISPLGVTTLLCGADQPVTIQADACYHIADVLVDNVSVGAVGLYTFTNVEANHTIAASFAIDTYTITASAGPNGAVSPNGVLTVGCGSGQGYSITPVACYHVADVLVDGSSVGAVENYNFENVTANHTLSATFAINTYTLTSSAGAGGSISPLGATPINCGSSQTFTIAPAACYHIADVVVDGSTVGAVGSYAFTNVTANHTIAASFAVDIETVTASAGPNGSISPSGAVLVNCGSAQAFTITPAACYHIADVLVDGSSIGAVSSYTFASVTTARTIAASFVVDIEALTATAGPNGAISPSGAVSVNCGSDQTFTLTPAACYHIADVLVDGNSVGAVTSYAFTNVTGAHTIAATFAQTALTVTASAGPNGAISPSGAVSVNCGSDQTFTITPAACYHIADVLVDAVSVGAVGSYTLTNVIASHTIAASFAIDIETITASAGPNGSISPSGAVSVNCGSDQTFTITPAACYHIADVLVDGVSVGAVASRTITNVTGPHTIAASFAIDIETVTASAGPNGSIAPSGATSVNCGSAQAFTIAPAACYHIADVLVDGVSVGAVGSYTFASVTAARTIAASFAIDIETVTASAGPNGSISPSGAVLVNCGSAQAFTIAPAACYHIADVLVDGSSVGAVSSYTFASVTTAHTIAASFAIDIETITASAGLNGAISPSGAVSVNCGSDQTFTITPAACYHVGDVLVDGVSVGAVSSYTITNVTGAHTIAASFAQSALTVTASAGPNGTISPLGAVSVNCGTNQAFTITPAACYHIADVLLDGSSVGAVPSYTITNVTADHAIAAAFAINTYAITITSGANGAIAPAGPLDANCGSDQAFTITPAACYHIVDVLVDGSSIGAASSYTFNNVMAPHSIAATFDITLYGISATAGAGGTIAPSSGATLPGISEDFTALTLPAGWSNFAWPAGTGTGSGYIQSGKLVVNGARTNPEPYASSAARAMEFEATFVAEPFQAAGLGSGTQSQPGEVFGLTPYAVFSTGSTGTALVTRVFVSGTPADFTIPGSYLGSPHRYRVAWTPGSVQFSVDGVPVHTEPMAFAGTMRPAFSDYVDDATSLAVNWLRVDPYPVACGSAQPFTITPDPCYSVADVLVDGSSVGAVASYTFSNVNANHSIAASFSLNTFAITAAAGAGGAISPAGAVSVNCGGTQAFTITPAACYHIADVLVDGSTVGAVASYTFTNVTATHIIAASFAIDIETITASAGPNGAISPSGAVSVNCGSDQTFTITPAACYHIADVLVDGNSVGAGATYTFTNVTAVHSISASFAIDIETITASAGPNGSISPSGAISVNCGSAQAFTITPASCYHIADVLVDGASVGAVGSYTFASVTAARTIAASFAVDIETVTASAGPNGSISPAGAVSVNCGSAQVFTITPAPCYHIADVLVDGASVGAVGSYTFASVTAAHTIAASFAIDIEIITASAGPNGSISPSGAISVNCGSDQTFAITPASCYHIADVLVDGVSVGAIASYTLTNVTGAHTIAASFAQGTLTVTASAGPNGSISPSGAVSVNCGSDQAFTITPASCYHIADVLVDGVSVGAVASYTLTNVTAAHTIAASFAVDIETVTASAGPNGSISPSGAVSVNCGSDQAFTITPAACYHIADVLVDGGSVGAVASYTITNVTSAHSISASFAINMYTLTPSAGAGGTISPSSVVSLACGTGQGFSIIPNACFHIADVLVDGTSVGPVSNYDFSNVTANHTIAASFVLNTYAITASAGAGGGISPLGATPVNCGSDQAYTITADACYHIADVLVDGSTVGAVASYTFTNVTATHTIAASFAINTYTITASAGPNGAIAPSGAVVANCGSNSGFTITPAACYVVQDVLVDAVSVGAVASYTFTNVTANHTIAATFVLGLQTITASAGGGGSITPSGAVQVPCGTDQSFTVTADACYHIVDVLKDGVSAGTGGTYTFTNVTSSHTIAASFAVNMYTLTPSAGAGGSISPSAPVSVACGTGQGFTIIPAACQHIADVLVDGVSVGAVSNYDFSNVTANHIIAASFAIDVKTVTASAGTGGSISPLGAVLVNCGGDQAFTITPAACYHIADVLVDGVSVGAVASYTITNVTANNTIAASFALDTYTIAATAGTGGSIAPAGPVSVNCGGAQTFTVTANACYQISDVLVDGGSVGAVGSYTFTNATSAHTIAASFAITTYTIAATAGSHGAITPSGTVVANCGTSPAFTINADACYHIVDVLVDGASQGAIGSYTFTSVAANHTIAASFAINLYTLTPSAGAGGTISPNAPVSVQCGNGQGLSITPDACYHIADVLVDGVSSGPLSNYNFDAVSANHTIAASFAINTYSIAASAGAGGAIAPLGVTTVNCGSSQVYSITPAACNHIVDVLVDGSSVGAVASYTFTNVTAAHTIAASFAIDTYTISASAGLNGAIAPSGAVATNCGSNATFTITPAACYVVADVQVDAVSVGAVSTYTFTNVTANHAITATFALGSQTITASAGAGGSITPSGAVLVACGTDRSFTVTPDACYHIVDVLKDGVSAGTGGAYSFTNVTSAHTIAATFALNTYTITASAAAGGTIAPAGATVVNCGAAQTFTITPDACHTIADVLVDGVSVGTPASYPFTNVTANHTIAATFTLKTFTVTASVGAGGSINPSGAVLVNCGSNQAFAIGASDCYHIVDVLVDGVSAGAVASYTLTNVTANHTIAASFALNTYTVTASAGTGGLIAPSGAVAVNCGGNQAFTITPSACYHIADVLVDGGSVGAVGSYTFTTVSTAHTIAASFALNTYSITASAGPNGTIAPSGAVIANCGSSAAFTITPAACYVVADVLVDGGSVGAVASYNFLSVTANHTISATFALGAQTITASAGAGGSISPSGAVSVVCGSNQAFTVTPDPCYHIVDVLKDGVSAGTGGSYSFTNVTAAHTIAASFALNSYTITASAGAGGTITPTGAVSVNCGGTQAFTITANAGFAIAGVLVDAVSVGAVGGYSFTNVTANHTISATFVTNAFTINASAGANGSITPSGAVGVVSGANQLFTITPNAHYHVADVLVDAASVGAVGNYTFTNVTANHTIAASFAVDTYVLNITTVGSGSVAAAPNLANYPYGTAVKLTSTPAVGWTFAGYTGDAVMITDTTTVLMTAAKSVTATFQIQAALPPKILSLRADSSNGNSRYPIPSTGAPWIDLTGHGHGATLINLNGNIVSGWAGEGTIASPYRVEMTGINQNIAINQTITEMQTVGPITAEMWVKPSYDAFITGNVMSILDWLQADDRGMSLAVGDGQLLVGLADWVPVGAIQPDQWFHVVVAKDATGQRAYLNGVLVYTNADAYNGKQQTPIAIGASSYHYLAGGGNYFSGFFKGAIAQVEVWGGSLTGAQALAQFNLDKALYLPTPALPTPVRVTSLNAAKANGTTAYAVPGAAGPWVDLLVPTSSATLTNFNGTATSGWQGNGTPASPYRLKFDGTNDVAVIAPQAVSELHNVHAHSAEMWFQTPASVSGATVKYLLEWLAGTATVNGMSISVFNSQLQVKLASSGAWQACAPVAANTWYHVVVSKEPGQARVYLNGARVFTGGLVNYSEPYMNVTIGASAFRGNGSFGEYWGGAVAQLHFWKGAVTDQIDRDAYVASAPGFQQLLAVGDAPSELSLAGMRPNPAVGAVNVSFSLPNSESATLELIDITGRVVRAQQVGELGAGRHVVNLGRGRDMAAGIYWLRLTQGEHAVTAKATIVH